MADQLANDLCCSKVLMNKMIGQPKVRSFLVMSECTQLYNVSQEQSVYVLQKKKNSCQNS